MSARGGDCDELLGRLNGRKHLIVGNNDPETTTSASRWTSVQHYRELEVDGLHLILCHYAFRTWNKMGKKSINLHGRLSRPHSDYREVARNNRDPVEGKRLPQRPRLCGDVLPSPAGIFRAPEHG
jgi:calcineurin-like phosphoesterase family protein